MSIKSRRPGASELSRLLARQAEAVCRYYLPLGKQCGVYWCVGDVTGKPGRSLFVRLLGPDHGKGAAGHWQDAASGEFGDLLDLIAANRGLNSWPDLRDEALRFLGLHPPNSSPLRFKRQDHTAYAVKLWRMGKPIAGTCAQTWLESRGIDTVPPSSQLRFLGQCRYRHDDDKDPRHGSSTWPAMIAAVRDLHGELCGIHRTFLDPSGRSKAPVERPRRALGMLLGHGIHLGCWPHADDPVTVMAVGEGIETMLSLVAIAPRLPVNSASSSGHLSALGLPEGLERLYIAMDDDPAGLQATASLSKRAAIDGIRTIELKTSFNDLNDALQALGPNELKQVLLPQFAPQDRALFD